MNNNRILSILTNFGCHFACPYCVYRENGINITKTHIDTFGWDELEAELKDYKGTLVSISGGGDPLFNYEHNKLFYEKLFALLSKYNLDLEMHTSMIDITFPYERCSRVVFHFSMPTQISSINLLKTYRDLKSVIIRVVYVVQEHYTQGIINQIVKDVNRFKIDELSFRQMIGPNGETLYYLHDFLKEGHKKDWYYIEQCDYNEYFVQDHIEREYLDIK